MRPPHTWGERRQRSFPRRPGPKPVRSRWRLLPQGRPGPAGCSGRMVFEKPASRRGGDGQDDQQPAAGDREELGRKLSEKDSGQGKRRDEADPLHLSGSSVQKELMFFAASNELLVRRGGGAGGCRIAIGNHEESMPRVLAADKRKRLGRWPSTRPPLTRNRSQSDCAWRSSMRGSEGAPRRQPSPALSAAGTAADEVLSPACGVRRPRPTSGSITAQGEWRIAIPSEGVRVRNSLLWIQEVFQRSGSSAQEPGDDRSRSRRSNQPGDSNGAGETAKDPALAGDEPYDRSGRDFPAPTAIAEGLRG